MRALTALGLTAAALVPAVPAAAADPLDAFHHQKLRWTTCHMKELDDAGARCADVTVPLDYARPRGRTIKVAISRLKATGPRLGTMLINGGGPGPAIDMPPYIRSITPKAGPRFDLIGMDPRGLGRSTPVDCGWPSGTWIRAAGGDRRGFDASVASARSLAGRCLAKYGSYLPYISTRNIARDMDVVRAALGERKISYNGASYGTYLGAVYATLFPGRLDRTVLDSNVDPDRWSPRLIHGTEEANERALAHWADWTARRDTAYHLGRTRAEVLATVHRVLARAGRSPLLVGPYKVDDTVVPTLLFNLLSDDRDQPRTDLARTVADLNRAANGAHVPASGALGDALKFLLTGADSRYGSGQAAIICGDAPAPRNPETYWRDIQRERRVHPVFGSLGANIGPCAFWPSPREPRTKVRTTLPSLLIGATGDTRTVYAGSLALHRDLKGSRLLTLKNADVHAPYQAAYGNPCLTTHVDTYLLTTHLPPNTTCP
ncbi:alpha/beta fold hydrolase [Actinomadura rupiterrae]|uniref:alpha/beta fold hydrolase n=1 Tax=Actinomadura rupiterrae TaxID=559627 RepID=UPI0020A27395|nr:alpha/beta fold hydrolase [Actinomadura rupiterrae]MCP2336334.1 pimeloyl-ACP methyl ester carboxylesterase [Actinomadura rupiterrae]